MSTWQHNPNSDFRNEGWTLHGSGVTQVNQAWSSTSDDTKYCSNPANKGRAACKFPVDISSGSIPDGAVIESVTVWIRAAKTDSGDRSVTVNVLCSDDTSHFTQRTVHLTTDISTTAVATYTADPLGKPWTKDRINRLIVQTFSYCGASDRVRIYSCYAVINYRAKPVVKVTAPSGSVDSAAPAIGWTYTQDDGDPQAFAEYKIYTAAQQEAVGFNPDTTPALYPSSSTYTVKSGDSLYKIAAAKLGDGNLWPEIYQASVLRSGDPNVIFPGEILTIPGIASIQGDITALTALPFALAQNDYYIYVRATSTRHARSDWANRAFTVTGGLPGIPGGSLGGVGTGGGGGFESVIADSTTSNAYLTLRDGSNLLGAMQADFESLTDSLGYVGNNCTIVQDTTTSFGVGGASMKLTASTSATMSASSSYMQIGAGLAVTARAQFRAAATSRTVNVWMIFYDAAFNALGGTFGGTGTDLTTTWTEVVATGTTPTGTVYYQVQCEVVTPTAGGVHNVDHVGVMLGTNSAWSNGGHASRNLLTNAQSTADDPITVEPWAANTSASTYSRVTTTGTGSEGAKAFKILYAGLAPSISFVATGTAFTDTTTGTGFTLNKPAGVVDGDVLMAYVAANTGVVTTAPTGWTVVDSVSTASSTLSILMRDGLAADASSWTGNLSASATRKRAVVVAYRGAASTANQFPPENVGSSISGSTLVSTPTVNNANANAFRLSAFAVNDDATGGGFTANITPPSVAAGIAYVGRAAVSKVTTSSTTYTINRPSGVVSGDLMIASVAVSSLTTINAASGWTLVRQTQNSQQFSTHAVLKRTAGASEPTSWSGTVGTNDASGMITQASAYRNCDLDSNQFIAENGTTNTRASIDTPTITNTDSKAWRVSIFAYQSDSSTGTSSNEYAERSDDSTYGTYAMSTAMYDSNGTVSTGYQSRSASATNYNNIYSGHAWIGLLKPTTSGTSPGANETERQDATAGASNPWLTLAAYDSNGSAATGSTTVYGSFTPGSGTTVVSSCAWLGFLVPSASTIAGEVGANLASYVDISTVSSDVAARAGNQVSVSASFLGSTAGTPHVKLFAYVGNELISTQVAEGSSFGTTTWVPSSVNFVLPQGTTRLKVGVTVADRAASDYVLFDKVLLAYGSDAVWRPGTGNAAHPVFNVPVIQFAEDVGDGYGDWTDLPFTTNALLKYDNATGLCTFVDQAIVPLSSRKYRAKTASYGLAGDIFVSGYGPESDEVTLMADDWWLKDMAVPDNSMTLRVREDFKVATQDTSAVFQPLGADRPVVITEGYKGDVISLTLWVDRFQLAQLRDLFNARRTLYLQSNIDKAWWVRPNGDIASEMLIAGFNDKMKITNPQRFVTVSFVEVTPEA